MFSFVPSKAHRWAMLLGGLTAFFCLLVADGFFGLFAPNSSLFWRYTFPGTVIYWTALLGLPVLFRKKVQWKDTWVNFFLCLLLFFLFRPIPHALGIIRHSKYLRFSGGEFFSIPGSTVFTALRVSLRFFLVQGLLLLGLERAAAWRAEKKTVKDLKDLVGRVPSWVKYALLLAVLTDIFALFIADGLLGLRATPGKVLCVVTLILLPILFHRKVRPLQTAVGIPLHIGAYYILKLVFADRSAHAFIAYSMEWQHVNHTFTFQLAEALALFIWTVEAIMIWLIRPRDHERGEARKGGNLQ